MGKGGEWASRSLVVSAVVTWVLANGVDLLSMLYAVQMGEVTFRNARLGSAEFYLVYAGFRLLGTMAVGLAIGFVSKHWPTVRSTAWSALTAFSLVTAFTAWWRLYR
jgi:hypothetical protein